MQGLRDGKENQRKLGDGMGDKLKNYISSLYQFINSGDEIVDAESFKAELLREISFWQHERLIHLMVVMLFALITIAVLLVLLFYASIPLLLLFVLLMVLLVPYIKHYYVLENGVQTLYVIYEEITRRTRKGSMNCIPEDFGVKTAPFDSYPSKQ